MNIKINLKIILHLSILAILCNACKEDEKNYGPTTYQGKVYERGSTVGISNCPILIHGYDVSNPWGSADMPTIAETVSDAKGNYSITWNAEKGKRYYIYPESLKHYGNSKGQPVWELNQFGKTVTKNLEQWPLSYVKMKLLNRHKYNDYSDIIVGSKLNGMTLFPGSKDTNYIAEVWGNIADTVVFGRNNGINRISVKKIGYNIRAWQTDSITIEY